jgi:polysaccharide biosynthesis transport protein
LTDIAKRDRPELPRMLPREGGDRFPVPYELRAEEGEGPLALRRLVARIFRRKALILAVFLIVVIPAAVGTWLTTPLYRSTALVQVNADAVQVLPYRDVAESGGGGGNFENYMGTQEQILRGAGLRARVAERLASGFQHESWNEEASLLSQPLEVRKIEKSQIFELSYSAPHPQAAATIVNLFAEEYIKQNFEMRQATRVKAEQELKKELEALEGRLQLSEQELMAYAKNYDIVSLEQGQVDPLQEKLSFFSQQVSEHQAQLASARVSLDTLQNASTTEFPQRIVSEQIRQLEGRLLQLEQELTTLRTIFGVNWPAVVEKRAEVALVREQLTREKTATLASHREQAQLDLRAAQARHEMSKQALGEQKDLVNRFHDASIQYNIFRRDVETNRNLYDGLLERLRQTGVLTGLQFGNIQVVEPGRASFQVHSPKVVWNLAIAALLGLALGICLVIGLDSWDTSISTPEELEQLGPLPSLGSLPLMGAMALPAGQGRRRRLLSWVGRRRPGHGDAVVPSPDAPLPFEVTESVRSICASLLLSRSDATPRVLVVTSATHAEGKTTVVSHLGRAFADAGVKTLLIEADLRKPDLSRSFGVGSESGLSLYLAGHVAPWPKIHETEVPNLFIAAGGPVPPNPAALLHSDRLGRFLQAAAGDYQIVVVDAPPLLAMADARILASQADGVVLVVRAGRTGSGVVRRAARLLEAAGANVLGLVLNAWQPGRSELTEYGYYRPAHVDPAVR